MDSVYTKILVVLLIFLGEALAIYAEMLGAKSYSAAGQPALQIFLKMFLIIAVAGGFLLTGYMFGYSAFKNIWVVSVASITSILVMEPIIAFSLFRQVPGTGQIVGFVFGVLGFIAAIFF